MAFDISNTVTGYTITPVGNLYTNVTPVVFTALFINADLPFNAVWLFGDGTYHASTDVSVTHRYKKPGTYKTTLIAFNTIEEYRNFIINNDLSLLELPTSQTYISFTQTIVVRDYIQDEINVTPGTSGSLQSRKSDPIRVDFTISHNQSPSFDIFSAGSESQPPQNIEPKWSHLKPRWRFLDTSGEEITTLTPVASSLSTLILVNNTLSAVPYDIDRPSTEVVGLSGYGTFYYVDDFPGEVDLHITLNTSDYNNPYDKDYSQAIPSFANSLVSTTISHTISASSPAKLVITSNGLPTFSLAGVKWEYSLTPYVITICDADGYTLFNYPIDNVSGNTHPITVSAIGVDESQIIFQTDTPVFQRYDEKGVYVGGYYTGFFQVLSAAGPIHLIALADVETETGVISLSGQSASFNVVDYTSVYDVRRFNESFNMADTIKSYALQETISQNTVLFDGFLGQIVGGDDAPVDTIGKSIYERIANYVGNTSDIDVCNVDKLYSICQALDIPIENFNFEYPANIRRIMDILSISFTRLKGSRNLFNKDFVRNASTSSAPNLGSVLDTVTYYVTAGIDIVAQEKGTNNFELINTVPIDGEAIYPLAALSAVNLKTPVERYYRFYEYIPHFDNTQQLGLINWDDEATTLSESISSIDAWVSDTGTMDTILDYHLRKGLGLLSNN